MTREYCSVFFAKAAMPVLWTAILQLVLLTVFTGQLHAAEPGILQGEILDVAGRPVSEAEIYIFDSPNVKRPADFISNRTVSDGIYQVQLPGGDYWAVAIYRQGGGRFGPLSTDDKHSGDPVALTIKAGEKRSQDFVVMNLREAARQHEKKSADLIRISGKILDESGAPAAMAYAMAHKLKQFGTVPDYISAWTDEQGEYALYLPPGRYYLGASLGFPPKHGYNLPLDQQFVADTENVDLVVDKVAQ